MSDKLSEIRSAARAKSVEDFQYFCEYVLGFHFAASHCETLGKIALQGGEANDRDWRANHAVELWKTVIGKASKVQSSPSETFTWLFPELVQRAA